MQNIRTDLALENHEYFTETAEKLPGVSVYNKSMKDIKVTQIEIETEEAAKEMGKPIGTYITLEFSDLRYIDKKVYERLIKQISLEINQLLYDDIDKPILVIGLGNRAITSDSLGPDVIDKLIVTRHMFTHAPEVLSDNFASVCAMAPGVLGITGIETEEIVTSICDKVKPSAVIVVDALAARSIKRITKTVQICNTGINPGSGIGNNRREISEKTLGIPVIAIGVPTVVDALTITGDTLEMMSYNREDIFKITKIPEEISNFTTTPKEIDILVKKCADIVANGINFALHDNITFEDIDLLIN